MKTLKTKTMKKNKAETGKTSAQIQPEMSRRYSDEDLLMFKGNILKKLSDSEEELVRLKGNIPQKDGPLDKGEEGSYSADLQEAFNKVYRQERFSKGLKEALIRIEQKTYGICRETGKLIPKERLLVVPHATLCAEAKNLRDK